MARRGRRGDILENRRKIQPNPISSKTKYGEKSRQIPKVG
jgi:hypothetical protein